MTKLSVHPHIGYLNTEFSIQSFSDEKKMVLIYPIDKSKLDKPVFSFLLLNEKTLQANYAFKLPGRYVVMLPDDKGSAIEIEVKDAIKFGGSMHKNSYVFEETPWCFIVMKDRTYFYNRNSGEKYVECISPDKISCINKDVVLLSNESYKEKTLYSLTEQTPIITFTNEILLQDDILIVKNEMDGITKLNVYHFSSVIFNRKEYECEDFSVCKESRILCIYESQQIHVISLDSFETIKTIRCDNKFIKFTNKHYFVELEQQLSCTIMFVKDILSNQSWYMSFEYPISTCEYVNINDIYAEEDKVDRLFNLAEELDLFNTKKAQFLGGLDISYRDNEIEGFYVLSNQLYYLVKEYSYTINRYGTRRKSYKVYLRISKSNFNLEIDHNFPTIVLSNNCLYITTYNHVFVVKDEKVIFSEDATLYQFNNRTIISVKDGDTGERIYDEIDDWEVQPFVRPLITGRFNWKYFTKYGILERIEDKTLYVFTPHKCAFAFVMYKFDDAYCSFSELPQEMSLMYGEKIIYSHGIKLLGAGKIILPENITALSEKKNYAISIKGSHVFLGRISGTKDSFVNEEILESLFDSSSFGNVLMSDNGKNIIFQKDKEMFLMNTETKEVQDFPNLNFISQINGYRPLFKVDDSHRRPRIIDPLTKEYINQDFITNYGFVSPDGNLYADSALSKYVKYHDKVNDTFISKEQWHALAEKYDYEWKIDDKTKDEKKEARKEFIYAHKNFFNGEKIDDLLKINDFKNKIAEELGYAIIRETGTDKIYCEIELGHVLWFLNYVAFSYDSRYVAIAGRYPNDTEINGYYVSGLFMVYDMAEQKEIAKSTTSYAVWSTAFTNEFFYAAYDSHPILLYGNVCNDEGIKEVGNRNFLTFSPDGKYMALSNQGYVPYSPDNLNWGHQPSTSVYIHAINDPNKQIMPTIDDLSDVGIADTNKAKSVSSCSFSLDNKKLMMVGNDGTVVIRNLHLN